MSHFSVKLGVLLTQAFLEEQEKKRCNPYYNRYKRDDVMGRFFGGNKNKPCPPGNYPRPPHHGGPYRPPHGNYPAPQRPVYPQPHPQPYPQPHGYAPAYPNPGYQQPYPNPGYQQPYPVKHTPAYTTPKPTPVYQRPPHYTPTPQYPQRPNYPNNNQYYPPRNQGYAPAFNGRSLPSEAAEEVKADTGAKLSDTGSKLGGGRVVFADD